MDGTVRHDGEPTFMSRTRATAVDATWRIRIGRCPSDEDLAGGIHRGAAALEHVRVDGRPRLRIDVELNTGRGLSRTYRQRPPCRSTSWKACGYHGIDRDAFVQLAPCVGRWVVDFWDRRVAVLAVHLTRQRQNAAISQRREGRIPATLGHVRSCAPRIRHGIENAPRARSNVSSDVAAGDEHTPVGENRVASAEDVRAITDRYGRRSSSSAGRTPPGSGYPNAIWSHVNTRPLGIKFR